MSSVRFMSLSSGSCGNCYWFGSEAGGILIDAGVSLRRLKSGLQAVGAALQEALPSGLCDPDPACGAGAPYLCGAVYHRLPPGPGGGGVERDRTFPGPCVHGAARCDADQRFRHPA